MGYNKRNTMVFATQKRIKNLLTDCGCSDCHGCKDIVQLNTFENLSWNFDMLFQGRSNINCPCLGCKNDRYCLNNKYHKKNIKKHYKSKNNWGCGKSKRKCDKCPNCVYCPPCSYKNKKY